MKAEIDAAWKDPRPSRPAAEVFARLEKIHSRRTRVRGSAKT
jgi:hypothetical protein